MFMGVHKMQRMVSTLTLLEWYHKDADECLIHIVTGGEIWVSFLNVETKEQLKQWMHTHSPNKLKNCKHMSYRKLIAAVFWDRKGVLMVEFVQEGTTVMSEVYCETLKKLCGAT
jgi:hypothetical protein